MIGLRIIGGFFAILLLYWIFINFRRSKIGRPDFIFLLLLSVFLLSVTVYPPISNILVGILSIKALQYQRIIAILIASNFILFINFICIRTNTRNLNISFDLLVRDISKRDFIENNQGKPIHPILVVIPVFNEKKNLQKLLPLMPEKIQSYPLSVLVVDDGSTDGTDDIVRELGFPLVRNRINRGGGAALRLGYDIANDFGADIIVTMDGDNQHDPDEIERLLQPLIADQCDIVVGSRILGKNLSPSRFRLIGVYVFNYLIRFLTGVRITDCSSGFRAFRMESVSSLMLIQDQYHTSEFIIEATKMRLKIQEVPITFKSRYLGASKKGPNWAYALRFLSVIITTWFRKRKR
jgi:hypothetical protein